MAIGSNPEIGITFDLWKNMTPEQRREWFAYMRSEWGSDLLKDYGTLAFPPRGADNPYYERDES